MAANIIDTTIGSTNNNSGGSAPSIPSSCQLGDLLIAHFGNNRSNTHAASGWTAILNSGRAAVLWKIATSTEVSNAGNQVNFGSQIGQSAIYGMMNIRGHDPLDPIPAATVYPGSTGTPGTIATATTDDLIIAMQGGSNDTAGSYTWSNTTSNSNVWFINEGGGADTFMTTDQARGTTNISVSLPNTGASIESGVLYKVKALVTATGNSDFFNFF